MLQQSHRRRIASGAVRRKSRPDLSVHDSIATGHRSVQSKQFESQCHPFQSAYVERATGTFASRWQTGPIRSDTRFSFLSPTMGQWEFVLALYGQTRQPIGRSVRDGLLEHWAHLWNSPTNWWQPSAKRFVERFVYFGLHRFQWQDHEARKRTAAWSTF